MRVPGRRHWRATGIAGILATIVVAGGLLLGHGPASVRAARTDVKIAMPAPTSLDPAGQSDIDSAAVAAQLFESLTTFDTGLVLRPALAKSWDVSGDGQQVTFHLRPGLTFSDDTPLTGGDVVRSWLRIIDPQRPSPLATLMLDVKGARDYLTGAISDAGQVGIHAQGQDVIVDLERPGADFPSVVASPTFAVMAAPGECASALVLGQCGVSSGGYTLSASTDTELTLHANSRYWAGTPAIQTVHVLIDLGGRSPVEVFSAGEVDSTPIASNDASWIRFDRDLGPSLRTTSSLSLTYLGFDTSKPPFDNADVRRAFGQAVDWPRIVQLGTFGGDMPATSMVPPGIPGRSDTSWLPTHDPAGARGLLSNAGYPDGKGFPDVALGGGVLSSAIAADLKRELGITVRIENYDNYFTRLSSDAPGMWALGWVADYPGQNDFLGVLLETGASGNYGHWSSTEFDRAISQALASREPARASAAFDSALSIVQSDVPAIPLAYPAPWWSLTRDGLLGAGVSGLGIPRFAGLAWAP